MNFVVEHELPGRLRLRCQAGAFSSEEAPIVGALLETQEGVTAAVANSRTGSLLIHYCGDRSSVLAAVKVLHRGFFDGIDGKALVEVKAPSLSRSLVKMFVGIAVRAMLPTVFRAFFSVIRSFPLLRKGIRSLLRHRRLNVSVLDASAVGISLIRQDYKTASMIATLIALGDMLEDWTHKKSRESLAESLILHVDTLWVRKDGAEIQVSMKDLEIGDLVVVRSGSVIPVDGEVVEGEAMVNQSSMTGESAAVHRDPGLSVYAGTVVEEGEILVKVTALQNDTRISRIVKLIDESEALKAKIQNRAESLADAIVPYSFILAGVIFLTTGNALRASAALMVDYSCAIKLATPLAILSAMREGAQRGVLIKGGKFLEAMQEADTVVFDKTGTLTVSMPRVAKVIAFEGFSRDEVLRTAACLEEHFPHSVARAVVRKAEEEGLSHREEHSRVDYVVAHGIVSHLHGEKVLIGSAHFVFDDEAIPCTPLQRSIIDEEVSRYSVLYLASGGVLAGIICVEDPLRPEAVDIVADLKNHGVSRVIMLTGDNQRVAETVAKEVGVDVVMAELLPEDKTNFIMEQKAMGSRIAMVGDGVNDSPALAAADVGIAMRSGADIAREVADVVLTENNLAGLLDARKLGLGVMKKIQRNYRCIVGINSALLMLGLTGAITPATSALLHNLTTLGASAYSLMPILDPEKGKITGKR